MRLVFLASVVFCLSLEAQKTTELFIPIGKSPGLSEKGRTIIGTVIKIEGAQITVGNKVSRLSEKAKVFLDRSQVKKTNTLGTLADIQVGSFVEIFPSEWIKVRINTP